MAIEESTVQAQVEQLNDPDRDTRLSAAGQVGELIATGELTHTPTREVNNHVHTIYSFSPYSPTMAAFKAWEAGLLTVGIMDHDSVAGCREMLEAGKAFDIAATVGFEVRVNFSGTPMEGRRLNHPDSRNLVYMAVHGIPSQRLADAREFLKPIQKARNDRNRAMTGRMNEIISPWGLEQVDFQRDVYAESRAAEGGTITERHLMWALAKKVVEKTGKGEPLVSFVESTMGIAIPDRVKTFLLDRDNPHYLYDLLGVFKSTIIGKVYIQPNHLECISVHEMVDFAHNIGAIPAYAYLGDVGESPTGDKKAQKFEDDFLDDLLPELKRIGFDAITYMPPRNTQEQLLRLQKLCRQHDLMEISGVDINSSRQSFNCPKILEPDFRHLAENTFALIAHEKLATHEERMGLFHPENPLGDRSITDRLNIYAEIGRHIDNRHPGKVWETAEAIVEEQI